ncbi:MAG: hypothetical protein AB7G06_02660 [Bdellovibrionales bacterium]
MQATATLDAPFFDAPTAPARSNDPYDSLKLMDKIAVNIRVLGMAAGIMTRRAQAWVDMHKINAHHSILDVAEAEGPLTARKGLAYIYASANKARQGYDAFAGRVGKKHPRATKYAQAGARGAGIAVWWAGLTAAGLAALTLAGYGAAEATVSAYGSVDRQFLSSPYVRCLQGATADLSGRMSGLRADGARYGLTSGYYETNARRMAQNICDSSEAFRPGATQIAYAWIAAEQERYNDRDDQAAEQARYYADLDRQLNAQREGRAERRAEMRRNYLTTRSTSAAESVDDAATPATDDPAPADVSLTVLPATSPGVPAFDK